MCRKLFFGLVLSFLAGCEEGLAPKSQPNDAPPIVDAGEDIYTQSGDVVKLSANIVDDGISGIEWTQIEGPVVALSATNRSRVEFTAPLVVDSDELTFQVKVFNSSHPPVSDDVKVNVYPAVGADVVTTWNRLGLSLVKKSERGPTVSGRFMAYLNGAMYSTWSAFDELALGWISTEKIGLDLEVGNETDTLQSYAMAVAAHQVFVEFASGESTILRQKHLEIGTNEDAEVFRNELIEEANGLLTMVDSSTRERLNPDTSGDKLSAAKILATNVADAVISYSLEDGSQALNDYADASSRYAPTPWAGPAPTRAQRNKINFYNEIEYVDEDGVEFPEYDFPDFDPRIAARAVGATWNDEGKLEIPDVKRMTINPAVLSGEVKLTSNWQSLTEWGIFPPADDGGTQIPLTSHWGEVKPFSLSSGSSLRPASIAGPYNEDGTLNTEFVEEVNQVIFFAEKMKDRAEGGALQRAQSEYWELGDATAYPPGWWLETAIDLVEERDSGLSTALKVSTAVSMAVFDSGIAAWDTKYHFDSVRPYTAVNQIYLGSIIPSFRGDVIAGTDDRNVWFPFQLRRNFTPPFPDIPSGHSTFSYAASTVLKELFGSNSFEYASEPFVSRFDLTDGFDGNPENGNEETTLAWDSMSLAAEEAGVSRLYGGIHLMEGNWVGLKFGIQIGHATLNRVNSLFSGSDDPETQRAEHWLESIPKLAFGTMKSDELIIETAENDSVEAYGFYEDDVLIVSSQSADGSVELFGGDGNDVFVLGGSAEIRIRDYQLGEKIRITAGPWGSVTINDLELEAGDRMTEVLANSITIAKIDGVWTLDSLEIEVVN